MKHRNHLVLWGLAGLTMLGMDYFAFEFLVYGRENVDSGEWYRLLTSHFVHFTPTHLLMNWLALLLAGALLLSRETTTTLLWLSAVLALFIGLSQHVFTLYLMRYAGFSGVLHGLIVFGLIRHYWLGGRQLWWVLLLILFSLKIVYEQTPWYDTMAMKSTIGVAVATSAHLFGAIFGALFAGMSLLGVWPFKCKTQ